MKLKQKTILGIAGVIGLVVGVMISIPFFIRGQEWIGTAGVLLSIIGLVLLAISFGD
ncbi:hypothetical protein JW968_01295 [Candidatus Woesearchaeota archaeon]|nr:hypothetical protein [Candidatus Woesearchaeota archaeon]